MRRQLHATRGAGALPISDSTTIRRLHETGLKSRVPALKPYLEPHHKRIREAWGLEKIQWDRARWKTCLFTDESRFQLVAGHRRPRVWRRKTERRLDERFVVRQELFGGGSVMVWGGIAYGMKTPLVIIDGTMTAMRYRDEILEQHVRPLADAAAEGQFLLVDDNARPHRGQVVNRYLTARAIQRMDWPAKSPDLNPIENLWGIMKHNVTRRLMPNHTLVDLRRLVLEEWNNIPIELVNKLTMSMNKRARQVVEHHGSHIDY